MLERALLVSAATHRGVLAEVQAAGLRADHFEDGALGGVYDLLVAADRAPDRVALARGIAAALRRVVGSRLVELVDEVLFGLVFSALRRDPTTGRALAAQVIAAAEQRAREARR